MHNSICLNKGFTNVVIRSNLCSFIWTAIEFYKCLKFPSLTQIEVISARTLTCSVHIQFKRGARIQISQCLVLMSSMSATIFRPSHSFEQTFTPMQSAPKSPWSICMTMPITLALASVDLVIIWGLYEDITLKQQRPFSASGLTLATSSTVRFHIRRLTMR